MTVEDLIFKEIDKLTEELEMTDPGTKEYEVKSNRLDRLMDKAIEIGKYNVDREDKITQNGKENNSRLVGHFISAAGIVLPIIVTIWGTKATLKFEETGTVTTIMGRGFINKLLPKK